MITLILMQVLWPHIRGTIQAANIAEGTHHGNLTKLTDVVISTRYLLLKFGSDADHVAINTASDRPLGVCDDEAGAAEENVNVNLLGRNTQTDLMVASEALAANVDVFTAAGGKIQNEPAVAGTYYWVGRTLEAADADGDVIEIDSRAPTAFVVPA